jgi:branched-chain amino acid transport system substrate-binding protein
MENETGGRSIRSSNGANVSPHEIGPTTDAASKREERRMHVSSTTKKLSLRTFIVSAVVTTVALPACAQEPIKIGAVLSVTGAAAGLGVPERDSMLAAIRDINAKGGVNGRQLKAIIHDDTTNADTAVSKVNDLIYNEKIVALIGGSNLPPTVAMGGITDKIKLPEFAFTGLGPEVEKSRTCLFHMFPPHQLNARVLLGYATDALKAKKIAILYDSGYGAIVMRELERVVGQYPVEVVDTEKFEISATDVTAQAAKIKAANPDVILIIAIQAAPFRAVRDLQMTQPIIALNGASGYETVSAMGSAANNIVFPEFVINEDPLPNQSAFVDFMKQNYGMRVKTAEATSWDAVHIIARALEKVGPDAGNEKLCQAIRAPYEGVTTRYDFSQPDMTGVTLSGYVFSKLDHGVFTRLPYKMKDQ